MRTIAALVWVHSTVIKTRISATQNPVTHVTAKQRVTCVPMGSKHLASPEDAGCTGLVGEQWSVAVTILLLAKNCNEALGKNSFSLCHEGKDIPKISSKM